MDTVKASAAIRKDLKELEALKAELNDIHQAEEKKAIKKARSVRGVPSSSMVLCAARILHLNPMLLVAAETGR